MKYTESSFLAMMREVIENELAPAIEKAGEAVTEWAVAEAEKADEARNPLLPMVING